MARYNLMNSVRVGLQTFSAGETIDDTVHPFAAISAGGGVLIPVGLLPALDTLSQNVMLMRKNRGIDDAAAERLLAVYIDKITSTSTQQDTAAAVALADSTETITIAQGPWRVASAALTANRTKTLSPTGATAGDQITITRTEGAAAFTLAVVNGGPGAGTLFTMPASKVNYAKFQFDGANWALREMGTN